MSLVSGNIFFSESGKWSTYHKPNRIIKHSHIATLENRAPLPQVTLYIRQKRVNTCTSDVACVARGGSENEASPLKSNRKTKQPPHKLENSAHEKTKT